MFPAAQLVDWQLLLEAIEISIAFSLALLLVAGLAVVASLRAEDRHREGGHGGSVILYGGLTAACLILIAGAIALGIWAMSQ